MKEMGLCWFGCEGYIYIYIYIYIYREFLCDGVDFGWFKKLRDFPIITLLKRSNLFGCRDSHLLARTIYLKRR